jgi:hypothetical protein
MDGLKVVTLSAGGRPIVRADIQDGTTYNLLRGTFKLAAGQKRQQTAQVQTRYGGSRVVAESQENGTVSGMWLIAGATGDLVNSNTEALLEQVDDAGAGRFLEWIADGSTRGVYLELRGPGQYTPTYEWVEYQGALLMKVELAWPVAPLPLLLPMDIGDPFDVDSIADYGFDAGAGTIAVAGGQLVPSSTVAKRLYHSARGHRYADVEATLKFTTGATPSVGEHGVILKRLDANNEIWVDWTGGVVRIAKLDGGAGAGLDSAATAALVAATPYWVRGRIEGNVVTAEFFTSPPTPMSAPAATKAFTLAGADATKFGAGVLGQAGIRLNAAPTDTRYDDLQIRPFTYRNQSLPQVIQLRGDIPGRAPALCDVEITPSGGAAAPIWAMIAWAKRASAPIAGSVVPFGILEAESGADLTGWAVTADAAMRGGSKLLDAAATGAKTYTASWLIDPSTLVPDDFTLGELDLEVWAVAIMASTLVSPRLTLSARPEGGTNFGAERFTNEWGSAGKSLTKPSAGTVRRLVRLGTLPLAFDATRPRRLKLWLAGAIAAGSTGVFGFDYLQIVVARQRALSPTSKPLDSSYPKFVASTTETIKRVRSDLSALTAEAGQNPDPDHGLGGNVIEIPKGPVGVLVKLSSLVPDDPTSDATTEQLAHPAAVHFAVAPRVRMLNG